MNFKDKKGSISVFVLVLLLFMIAFLIISYANNINKSKTVKEQFDIINGIYSYGDGDQNSYDRAYTALRNKNKQILTASVENSSNLELTKTFDENLVNYRIYGNEQKVGDKKLIIDNEIEHENIFDNQTENYIWAYFTASYTKIRSYNTNAIIYIECKPDTIYDISGFNGANPLIIGCCSETPAAGIDVSNIETRTDNSSFKYTTSEDAKYLVLLALRSADGADLNNRLDILRANIANMEVKEITTYKKYKISIIVNKNIFDNQTENYIWAYFTTSSTNIKSYATNAIIYIECKPNTIYNISGFNGANPLIIGCCSETPAAGIDVSNIETRTDNSSFKYTTSEDAKYLALVALRSADGADLNNRLDILRANIANLQIIPYIGIDIYLNEPLGKNDYIDYKTSQIIRNAGMQNETIEAIELPAIKMDEDYTKIEVLTSAVPSKIEVEYVGYTLE